MINSKMKTFSGLVEAPDTEGLYEMSNLISKYTGLPFVVWVSPKMGVSHDVRVKVSKGMKVHPSELISVAIRPDVRVIGSGELSGHDLSLLKKWIELNRDVIIKFWDGDIEDPAEVIAAIKSVR